MSHCPGAAVQVAYSFLQGENTRAGRSDDETIVSHVRSLRCGIPLLHACSIGSIHVTAELPSTLVCLSVILVESCQFRLLSAVHDSC